MNVDVLIERSPLQSIFPALRGGLGSGQVGGVMARAGVGKSAFLVHIALNSLLRGGNVLHVSLTDSQAHVRSFYDEIYTELLRASGISETPYARIAIERHRMVHSCVGKPFDADSLVKLINQFSDLMQFKPALVIVDGLDSESIDASSWSSVASSLQIRLWLSARTHRESGPNAADMAEGFSTLVELKPESSSVELHLHKLGGAPVTEHPVLNLDPVTMMLRPEEISDPITTPPTPAASQCTLYSGGAMGAESYFGQAAEKWGVKEVNFTFDGHNQKRTVGKTVLQDRELAAGAVSLVYVSRRLHRHWDRTPLLRKVLQVLWHVVSNSDQVFVVGVIQADNTVHGGTGWSVELARRWHKPLWVYDQERENWFYWDGADWKADLPVITTPNFAGSGTRFLSDNGRKAIDELFARSFGD